MFGFRNTLSTSCKNSEKEEIAKNPKRRSQCPEVKDNNPSTLFVCNSHSSNERKFSRISRISFTFRNYRYREIRLLKRLHHKNIIRLCEVLYNDEKQKIYPLELEYAILMRQQLLISQNSLLLSIHQ